MSDSTATSSRQHENKSQEQFLSGQIKTTQLALQRTALDIKDDALALADPRYWVPKFPLPALAIGAGLGFLALYKGDDIVMRAASSTHDHDDGQDGPEHGTAKKAGPSTFRTFAKIGGKLARYFMMPV